MFQLDICVHSFHEFLIQIVDILDDLYSFIALYDIAVVITHHLIHLGEVQDVRRDD